MTGLYALNIFNYNSKSVYERGTILRISVLELSDMSITDFITVLFENHHYHQLLSAAVIGVTACFHWLICL